MPLEVLDQVWDTDVVYGDRLRDLDQRPEGDVLDILSPRDHGRRDTLAAGVGHRDGVVIVWGLLVPNADEFDFLFGRLDGNAELAAAVRAPGVHLAFVGDRDAVLLPKADLAEPLAEEGDERLRPGREEASLLEVQHVFNLLRSHVRIDRNAFW